MPNKYNSWGLYNDPDDSRFIVPKMNPALGWTLNIAHPRARIALVGLVVILIAGMATSSVFG